MGVVYDIVVVFHLVGMAMIVGGWLAQIRSPHPVITPGILHGALVQIVTGMILVGLASSGAVDRDVDNAKIAVKLVVAAAVAGIAVVGNARGREAPAALAHAAGGLGVANVAIAVLW
ncbi:hypothetical protein CcI49_30935 [Frankia sp. CcI49]|uniref:hypothetical protein n=1 Tax=unclassified Frankia TaxID=2632575 RepID=UPI0006CA37A3|nr:MULTISPECIES: hypothetical protein [unclassified Frankia]KPM50687.1 hypothetical protein ACG83_38500 [Frankia sp. R43]ONH54085.1 hypothetical protein CcI49_30935 [Frankia sp. CcI49]